MSMLIETILESILIKFVKHVVSGMMVDLNIA